MLKPATAPIEDASIPFEDRAFTFDEACRRHLRVSRGTGYKLVKAGQLEIVKLGTRTIVTGAAIRACRKAGTVAVS
jgi:excisionase family DNA binding protein